MRDILFPKWEISKKVSVRVDWRTTLKSFNQERRFCIAEEVKSATQIWNLNASRD